MRATDIREAATMRGSTEDRPIEARADSDALTLFRASVLAEELEAAADAREDARRCLLHAQLDELARRRLSGSEPEDAS